MKNLYLFLICCFFLQNVHAQKIKACTIVESKAYATTIFPGIVMVDENGNEVPQSVNYSRRIYITTTCNKTPFINTILYNNTKAKFKLNAVTTKYLEIGNDNTGKKITISSGKTNYLWEVEIDLGENKIEIEKVKSIIIKGTNNKKSFQLNVKEINIVPLIMSV